jgi:hypothetical protein
MVEDPESKRFMVAALPSPKRLRAGRSKSFAPDHLSPFQESGMFILRNSLTGGRRAENLKRHFL